MTKPLAVVAMSGGQDSTTCLAWALDRWGAGAVHAVTFDYGQRHRVELDGARAICRDWNVPQLVLSVPAFAELGAAALTSRHIDVAADAEGTGNEHAERVGLPSTFVPGRNLVFLGLVAAYAAQHGIQNIVTGICEADASGYPDCRAEFASAFSVAAALAMGLSSDDLVLYAPLLHLDKAATWALADDLGVLDEIVQRTHTCYRGDREVCWQWGYGCNECPACDERRNGFEQFTADRAGIAR